MPSACAPSRSPCSRNTLRPRVGKCSTVSIPTCSWTSRQAAQALIRIFAIGESATSIAVAPASRSVWAAATSWAALKDRGGSISTVITSARASIAAWSAVGATAARAGTSTAGAGGGKRHGRARATMVQLRGDRGRMGGTGAATAAHDRDALVEQRADDLGHVLGGRRVDEAPAHLRRPTGVRPREQRHPGGSGDRREEPCDAQGLRRSLAAVHAEPVDAELEQPAGDGLRRVAEQRPVVAREGRAREQRRARRRLARRGNRLRQLAHVGLRLDHEQVDARGGERRGLLPVGRERLLGGHPAVRLESHAERADRARRRARAPASRASVTPAAQIAPTRSASPCWSSRNRFAPNVFVSRSRAPAPTKAAWMPATRAGARSLSASIQASTGTPVSISAVPIPPSASNGPSARRACSDAASIGIASLSAGLDPNAVGQADDRADRGRHRTRRAFREIDGALRLPLVHGDRSRPTRR